MPKTQSPSFGNWYKTYFLSHPNRPLRSADAFYATGSSQKHRLYCVGCFSFRQQGLVDQHRAEVALGTRSVMTSNAEQERIVWGEIENHTRDVPNTALNHLVKCQYTHPTVQERARIDNRSGSPKKRASSYTPGNSMPPPLHHASGSQEPMHYTPPSYSTSSSSSPAGGQIVYNLNSPPPGLLFREPGPSTVPSRTHSRASSMSSLHSIPNFSPADIYPPSPALPYPPPHSYSHPSSPAPYPPTTTGIPTLERWPEWKTNLFFESIARMTASNNFSLSWVENPETRAFMANFVPQAPIVSRHKLTVDILPKLTDNLRLRTKTNAAGKDAILQCDGWTGVNHSHLIAFMIIVGSQVFTVKVEDTSKERHTAEHLLALLEKQFKMLEEEWGCKVIAVVTDASGESRKARLLFQKNHPHVIILDCYAHQINLIVADFFKSDADMLHFVDDAVALIAWLRSKSGILAHLPYAVLRAVLTRWTAHYTAFRRLLKLRHNLTSIFLIDETKPESMKVVFIGDKKAKEKAKAMHSIIQDGAFWHSILKIVRHLEPLAIATNIIQGVFVGVDRVLLTFGFLYMSYADMLKDSFESGADGDAIHAIHASLESRWAKADQELFIAAVVLNPMFRTSPFTSLPCFNNSSITRLLLQLYKRLYGTDSSLEFRNDLSDYLHGDGIFKSIEQEIMLEIEKADAENAEPDVKRLYKQFGHAGKPVSLFISFALRVLGISANSASCERLFSVFGNILTKLRSRLGVDTLTRLAELKMHVRDEHVRNASSQSSDRKRNFGKEKAGIEARRLAQLAEKLAAMPPPAAPEGDESSTPAEGSSSTSASQPSNTFRDFVQCQMAIIDDDPDEVDLPLPGELGFRTDIIGKKLTLREMFDFKNTHWYERYNKVARVSFEEECAMYELMDFDGAADEDPDIDIEGDEMIDMTTMRV